MRPLVHSPPGRGRLAAAAAAAALLLAVVLVAALGPRGAAASPAKTRDPSNCECGLMGDQIGTRIVGGSIAVPHLYPWSVAILNQGKMHCGASLINDQYILTAGHCLKWVRKEDLTIILGLHDRISMGEGTEKLAEADELIVHEAFSSDYLHDSDDIALIRLKNPVSYNRFITPACMPAPGSGSYAGRVAMVTGWGRTAQGGNPSRYLRKADVKVMSQPECRNTTIGEHIMDSMLCAYEFETDACQGDSGGPLVVEYSPGKVEQIGVVSWGIGCAKPGMPGIYTRVTEYLSWIYSHTADATYCNSR